MVTAASIPLSISGMEIGVIALGGLSLVAVAARWDVVRRTPLDGVLAIFYAVLALSTLASGHPLEAGGWRRLWVVLAYFVVSWWIRDRAHAARLARIAVVSAGLVGAYGVLQHYTGVDWYRALLGRPTALHAPPPGGRYAVMGFYSNYLTFAHTMLFPLGWSLALAVRGSALGLVATAPVALAVVFSTSRGAWLGALAVGFTIVVLARRRSWGRALVVFVATACVGFALAPELRTRATRMFSLGPVNAPRLGIYRANLDVVRERPIFGLGFGRYRHAAATYYARHPQADRRSHAHSNYLHVAAEAGLAGLAAFTLVFAGVLLRGWPAVARAPDDATWAAAAGGWAATVGFLVGGVTQYSFGDNEVALTMWFTLAVLMRCVPGAALRG